MTVKPQRQKKMDVVEELKVDFQESQATILADYRGINVTQITKLRTQLSEAGVKLKVAKNTLVKRAANEKGIDGLDSFLTGPNALAFSKDPVLVAKILTEFSKTNKAFEIKAGLLEGKIISFDSIKELADLPSREVLLARILSGMMAPLNGMVNVLQGPMRNFAQVLEAYRKQQAGEA